MEVDQIAQDVPPRRTGDVTGSQSNVPQRHPSPSLQPKEVWVQEKRRQILFRDWHPPSQRKLPSHSQLDFHSKKNICRKSGDSSYRSVQ